MAVCDLTSSMILVVRYSVQQAVQYRCPHSRPVVIRCLQVLYLDSTCHHLVLAGRAADLALEHVRRLVLLLRLHQGVLLEGRNDLEARYWLIS